MADRSIWTGYLQCSLITIPIKVYNAVEDKNSIGLKMIHKHNDNSCGEIGYHKYCKKCEEILSMDQITKGYEYKPNKYIEITNEDISKIKIKSSKIIELQGFIDLIKIKPYLYEHPYIISPSNKIATRAYNLINNALLSTKTIGIGKISIRDRESTIGIISIDSTLWMYKLRDRESIKNPEIIIKTTDRSAAIPQRQFKLALELIYSMRINDIDEVDMHDRYEESLKDLISSKLEGKEYISIADEILNASEDKDLTTIIQQCIKIQKSKASKS